jgi:hypothetical protein
MKRITSLLSMAGFLTASAWAGTLTLNSDLISEGNNQTNGQNMFITPHPAWQPNGAGAKWISYTVDPANPLAETGNSPFLVSPPNTGDPITVPGANAPTAIFHEDFTLPTVASIGNATVTVWADDTSRVWLIGPNQSMTLLKDANAFQDGACAAGPIGCEPQEGAALNFASLLTGPGNYQLQFDVYQRGGGPFGLLYQGSVDFKEAPEPATWGMMVAGLACAVLPRLRRRNNS